MPSLSRFQCSSFFEGDACILLLLQIGPNLCWKCQCLLEFDCFPVTGLQKHVKLYFNTPGSPFMAFWTISQTRKAVRTPLGNSVNMCLCLWLMFITNYVTFIRCKLTSGCCLRAYNDSWQICPVTKLSVSYFVNRDSDCLNLAKGWSLMVKQYWILILAGYDFWRWSGYPRKVLRPVYVMNV